MTNFKIKRGPKGFTLIELLVVIAIIGVLASIVLASLATARRKSRDARRITDLKQIQLALELYFDGFGNGQYPQAEANCPAGFGTYNGLNRAAPDGLVNNGYIPSIPTDPLRTGTPGEPCYPYATPTAAAGTRTTYHIGASFEDEDNPALASDRDCNSVTAAGCPETAYEGATFDGGTEAGEANNSATSCRGGNVQYECYDLVP